MKKYVAGVVAIIVIFLLGYHFWKPVSFDDSRYVIIAGQKIKVDIALTPKDQEQGLSGRQSLGEKEGMLFIFNSLGKYPFWMKDMNFPIDMIWIGENEKVVYIKKNATPESYPGAYGPGQNDGDAKYVLEVSVGFSDKNDLKVGDEVEFR
ncbi:DUF192 domain-containing protein [Candidatus Nomurabacteria bacterium]|nr:DUF192 domain-containing protein [Candidatus Nomurabacteria bacterium]